MSIVSENVTEMLSVIETPLWLSVGETDETVGAVVSVVVVLSEEDELLFLAQEMMVRLKRNIKIMCKIFFIFSSIPKVKYYCFVY